MGASDDCLKRPSCQVDDGGPCLHGVPEHGGRALLIASPRSSPCQHPLPLGGGGTVVPLDPRADQQRAGQAQRWPGEGGADPTGSLIWGPAAGLRGAGSPAPGLSKGSTEEGASELDSDLGPHTSPFSSAGMDRGQHLPACASEETGARTPSQRKAASIKTWFYRE